MEENNPLEMLCSCLAIAFHTEYIGEIVDIRLPESAEKLAEWSDHMPEVIAPIYFALKCEKFFARPTQRDGIDGIEFLSLDELNAINFAKMDELHK